MKYSRYLGYAACSHSDLEAFLSFLNYLLLFMLVLLHRFAEDMQLTQLEL
jgi:hypothetical protein